MVDVVAGPTTGGVVLAFETARQLGVRSIFAEEVKDPDGTVRREFRRGFTIAPGERVLLVDDILTTGGSLLAMLPAVEAFGGEIVTCAVLADRSGGLASLESPLTGRSYPLRALWQLPAAHLRPGSGDLPGLRGRRAAPRARQHGRGRRGDELARPGAEAGAGQVHLQLELVADGDPVVARERDLRLEQLAGPGYRARPQADEAHPATLIEAEGVEIVVRGDEPEASSGRRAGGLDYRVQQRRPSPVAPLEGLDQDHLALTADDAIGGQPEPAGAVRYDQARQIAGRRARCRG